MFSATFKDGDIRELSLAEIEAVSGGDSGDAAVAGAIAGGTLGYAVFNGSRLGAGLGAAAGPLGALGGALIGAAGGYLVYRVFKD